MVKVKFVLCHDSSRHNDDVEYVEFDGNESDDEIEKHWQDWVWQKIDGYWEKQ